MLVPPSIYFSGNQYRAISLKSKALKFYQFVTTQADIGGVAFINRSLQLEDGSLIKVSSFKESNYGLRTGHIAIFGISTTPVTKKIFGGYVLRLQNDTYISDDLTTWKNAILLDVKDNTWIIKAYNYEIANSLPMALYYYMDNEGNVILNYKDALYSNGTFLLSDIDKNNISGEPLYLSEDKVYIKNDLRIVPLINKELQSELEYSWTIPLITEDLKLGYMVTEWLFPSNPIIEKKGSELLIHFLLLNETIVPRKINVLHILSYLKDV